MSLFDQCLISLRVAVGAGYFCHGVAIIIVSGLDGWALSGLSLTRWDGNGVGGAKLWRS